jgi:hypothetical protein
MYKFNVIILIIFLSSKLYAEPKIIEYKLNKYSSKKPYPIFSDDKVRKTFSLRKKAFEKLNIPRNTINNYNNILKDFNYKLVPSQFPGRSHPSYDLMKNETLILKSLSDIQWVITNKDKSKFLFYAEQHYDNINNNFIFENGKTVEWKQGLHGFTFPFYLNSKRYYIERDKAEKINDKHFSIYKIIENDSCIFKFKVQETVKSPIDVFSPLNEKYWLLLYTDNIVINGKYIKGENYTSVFGYTKINNNEFYFFKRNNKYYIKYDDKELNYEYDDILHYLCCEPGIFNPFIIKDYVGIYALKNNYWYYVEITK